jgi:hypothetical protein
MSVTSKEKQYKKMKNYSNKLLVTLASGLFLAGLVQAATLADINAAKATVDYTGEDFSGQSVDTDIDNWGYNDNFTDADFSDATFTFSGNQPFLATTITNADFSGATFNWTLYENNDELRANLFRVTTVTGTAYANASFANTVWNITLDGTSISIDDWFNDGSGALTADTASDAVDFSGAEFNFFGIGADDLADDMAAILISNLGGFDGDTAIGAKYDTTFLTNNYEVFGYDSVDDLETALISAGWQSIPESSAYALIAGFLGLGCALVRRRRA